MLLGLIGAEPFQFNGNGSIGKYNGEIGSLGRPFRDTRARCTGSNHVLVEEIFPFVQLQGFSTLHVNVGIHGRPVEYLS